MLAPASQESGPASSQELAGHRPVLRRSVSVMGTGATVELHPPLSRRRAHQLASAVFDWLHEVDRRFSPFKPDSEVSRLHLGSLRLDECSSDLQEVLARCAELWQETDGYFDVYASGRLDPSGYVKGWAIRVASELLTAAGAVNHLIDVGGDIQTRGRPAAGGAWRLGIRHPWQRDKICGVISGADIAAATSGTYERGGHIVNPYTGQHPTDLLSVTVVGSDICRADVYATTAVAMGRHALTWLAQLPDHESFVVSADSSCVAIQRPPPARSALDLKCLFSSPQGRDTPT